jgi:hypothetical protein
MLCAHVQVVLSVVEETQKHNCVQNIQTLMQEQLSFQIVCATLDIAAQTVVCAQLALLASGSMREGAQSAASALKIRIVCQRAWKKQHVSAFLALRGMTGGLAQHAASESTRIISALKHVHTAYNTPQHCQQRVLVSQHVSAALDVKRLMAIANIAQLGFSKASQVAASV